jgi:hypothetical protein
MHGCEIMLKDVADSKRINSNIKASAAAAGLNQRAPFPAPALPATTGAVAFLGAAPAIATNNSSPVLPLRVTESSWTTAMQGLRPQSVDAAISKGEQQLPLEVLDATIISSLFWPPFQVTPHEIFTQTSMGVGTKLLHKLSQLGQWKICGIVVPLERSACTWDPAVQSVNLVYKMDQLLECHEP